MSDLVYGEESSSAEGSQHDTTPEWVLEAPSSAGAEPDFVSYEPVSETGSARSARPITLAGDRPHPWRAGIGTGAPEQPWTLGTILVALAGWSLAAAVIAWIVLSWVTGHFFAF